MSLTGKTALITGGASGIGYATALRFATEGAAVAIADLNRDAGEAVAEEIRTADGRAIFVPCNVADEESVRALASAVQDGFGKLNILVNAAGILKGAFQSIEELDTAIFDEVQAVNVRGTFLVCKYAVPLLAQSTGGVVLCLASGAGVRGPSSSLAYGASKGGVNGLCMTLESQLQKRGIRLHTVCPGVVNTPMKRQNVRDGAVYRGEDPEAAVSKAVLADPEGIARILAFLASEDAASVVGNIFTR